MQERMTYFNKELLLKRIQDIRESVEIIKQYKYTIIKKIFYER